MSHHEARSSKSDDASRVAFRALVPDDPRVTVRPMFGSLAAFIAGQMFAGLYANDLFVRLGEPDRIELLAGGGRLLEPMPGRPMREYVVIAGWHEAREEAGRWITRALDYAFLLPPKKGR
jgi:hypothetical protein